MRQQVQRQGGVPENRPTRSERTYQRAPVYSPLPSEPMTEYKKCNPFGGWSVSAITLGGRVADGALHGQGRVWQPYRLGSKGGRVRGSSVNDRDYWKPLRNLMGKFRSWIPERLLFASRYLPRIRHVLRTEGPVVLLEKIRRRLRTTPLSVARRPVLLTLRSPYPPLSFPLPDHPAG